MQHKSVSKAEGIRFFFFFFFFFFKIYFVREHDFFATDCQENTTVLNVWVETIYARITGTSSLSDI